MTFEEAARKYGPSLLRRSNVLASRHRFLEAEDLLQDTWLQAWQTWDWVTGVGDAVIRVRLFHLLGQAFVHAVRHGYRQKRDASLESEEVVDHRTVAAPQDAVVELQQVAAMIDTLKPAWRESLELIAFGWVHEEIAEVGGVTRQAVQQRITGGRNALLAMGA